MIRDLDKITIVGGGLVGGLLACLLAQRGFQVEVFDMRPDPLQKEIDGGRSINLALSNRGWRALEKVGVEQAIRTLALPMAGRMMHDRSGGLTFQSYGKEGEAIFSVSRALLNKVLIEKALSYPNVRFHFNQKCLEADLDINRLVFKDYQNGKEVAHQANVIIGADGAFSKVREDMLKRDRFNYQQYFIEHGYKELAIPPKEGGYAIDPGALHIWPRKKFMLIALPNIDKSFTATLFLPFQGEISFDTLKDDDTLLPFFRSQFTDVVPHLPNLAGQFRANPTGNLVTIKCSPWNYKKAMVIGDAAHAIVPFYGQGMNAGFEDCFLFDAFLDGYQGDWVGLFNEFQAFRKKDADAISDLAMKNFVEMRDLVSDPNFLLRKKIEAHLHQLFPEKWVPLYSMVTFTHIPYAEALAIGQQQAKVMDKVLTMEGIGSKWEEIDWGKVPEVAAFLRERVV